MFFVQKAKFTANMGFVENPIIGTDYWDVLDVSLAWWDNSIFDRIVLHPIGTIKSNVLFEGHAAWNTRK